MDGDIAPIKKLDEVCREHNAWFIIDEAHAVGTRGLHGGGIYSELSLKPTKKTIIVGSLSKGLGSFGRFIACSSTVKEILINKAKSFIYSTELSPASISSALCAMKQIKKHPQWQKELLEKTYFLEKELKKLGFSIPKVESQIIPVIVKSNEKAIHLSKELKKHGIIVTAIRPPTVPRGTARLRLSVTMAHAKEDLSRTIKAFSLVTRHKGA